MKISNIGHAKDLIFQRSRISLGLTKVAQRGCDPGLLRGQKMWKMNVHSKK